MEVASFRCHSGGQRRPGGTTKAGSTMGSDSRYEPDLTSHAISTCVCHVLQSCEIVTCSWHLPTVSAAGTIELEQIAPPTTRDDNGVQRWPSVAGLRSLAQPRGGSDLTRGGHRMLYLPAPRQRPEPRQSHLPPKCRARKYSWAGAATPTQRSITHASAATERLDNDMFQGTPLTGKGNPTWAFSLDLSRC
jgi:hypothetical protein